MKNLNVYQQLQLGLVILLVGLFMLYVTLDVLHYELSDFATSTMMAVWAIILILIDAKNLSELIKGAGNVPTNTVTNIDKPVP